MSGFREPWSIVPWGIYYGDIMDADENLIAHTSTLDKDRIVATINACMGVTFEGDSEGAVRELYEAADQLHRLVDHVDGIEGSLYPAWLALDGALARFRIENES